MTLTQNSQTIYWSSIESESSIISNPFDTLRCSITEELAKVSGIDKTLLVSALSFANSLDKGDLLLAVPRFRIKAKKPQDLAMEWATKVSIVLQASY